MRAREGSLSNFNSWQHFDRKNYLFRISYFNKNWVKTQKRWRHIEGKNSLPFSCIHRLDYWNGWKFNTVFIFSCHRIIECNFFSEKSYIDYWLSQRQRKEIWTVPSPFLVPMPQKYWALKFYYPKNHFSSL